MNNSIRWDAANGYRRSDINEQIAKAMDGDRSLVVTNAHLLTGLAFYALYDFIHGEGDRSLSLKTDQPEKIFPPLLQYRSVKS